MLKCIDLINDYLCQSFASATDVDITCFKEQLRNNYETYGIAEKIPIFEDYLIIATMYKFDIGIRLLRKDLMTYDRQDSFDKNAYKRVLSRAYSNDSSYYLGTELQILIEYWAMIAIQSYPMSDSLAKFLEENDNLFFEAEKNYFEVDGSLPSMFERIGRQLSDIYAMLLKTVTSSIEDLDSLKDYIQRFYKTKSD